MQRLKLRSAFGFALLWAAAGGCASISAQPPDPLAALRTQRPRIIVTADDFARLRTLISQDAGAARIHEKLLEQARRLEELPTVEYLVVGPRLLTQSRRCLERVYTLALLYRIHRDKRYLERALKELRAAAGFPDWNPSHFLDTAEMTHAFAIGYDWLYDDLSPSDRAWLREAIIQKGIQPALPFYRQQRGWVRVHHNWNQVCNGGIGIGALAIADHEPELAREVINYARASLPLAMRSYAPDGGWDEGPGYWHYATRYNVYFLAALETALGTDFGLAGLPGFSRAGHFRVYFCGTSGRTFNYADAGDAAGGAAEMFWLARRFTQPVYAWHQRRQLEAGARPEALDLIWYQPRTEHPQSAGWPLHELFQGVNVAFLRSSWQDEDAVFVGVKGGDNKANHSQLDLGAFVLDAGRTRWAIDLGPDDYNLPQYFGKLRWTYYRMRSESHNTLLIDGENQDPKAAAPVVEHRFQPDEAMVRIDLTQAYPGRISEWQRTVGMLDRRQVVIRDRLRSPQPVEALWGMVTDAAIELRQSAAELRKTGWVLSARILSPAGAVFGIESTTPPLPQRQNEGTRKLVVRLPDKVESLELVVSLTPHRASEPAPKIRTALPF